MTQVRLTADLSQPNMASKSFRSFSSTDSSTEMQTLNVKIQRTYKYFSITKISFNIKNTMYNVHQLFLSINYHSFLILDCDLE